MGPGSDGAPDKARLLGPSVTLGMHANYTPGSCCACATQTQIPTYRSGSGCGVLGPMNCVGSGATPTAQATPISPGPAHSFLPRPAICAMRSDARPTFPLTVPSCSPVAGDPGSEGPSGALLIAVPVSRKRACKLGHRVGTGLDPACCLCSLCDQATNPL